MDSTSGIRVAALAPGCPRIDDLPEVSPESLAAFAGISKGAAGARLLYLVRCGAVRRVGIGRYVRVWDRASPWRPFGARVAAAFGVDLRDRSG